jgi:hypothetical protein
MFFGHVAVSLRLSSIRAANRSAFGVEAFVPPSPLPLVIGSDCFFDFMVLTKDGEAGFGSSSLGIELISQVPAPVAVVDKDDDLPANSSCKS